MNNVILAVILIMVAIMTYASLFGVSYKNDPRACKYSCSPVWTEKEQLRQ